MNHNEKKIFEKYEAQGYDCIKDGQPDIILLKDGLIEFVEVKYFKDVLNPMQVRAHNILKKHGVVVRTERVPKIVKSSLFEKFKKSRGR